MSNWFHKFFNPHCEHCAQEKREAFERERLKRLEEKEEIKDSTVCPSCETYKLQLSIKNEECERLLARLLEKPAVETNDRTPVEISKPRMIPWNVRRQMLEAEDRERARLMRSAPKPLSEKGITPPTDTSETTEELEKEILNADANG